MNNQGRGGRGGRKGRGGGRGAHGASNRTDVAARSSQTAVNSNTNCSGYDSQRTTDLSSGATAGSCQQRGRKRKSRTELKMPPHAGRIVLEPMLDTQFKYSAYLPKKAYTYTAQLGVILKKEYPGLVEDMDDNGEVVNIRAASCWDDYYLCPDSEGVCHADRVKREFWHLFEVKDEHKVRANVVLEKYAVGRVKDMMYSARVDAVKEYYRKQGEIIDESLARSRVLDYEKYMEGRVWWCMEDAWKLICRWWCSDEFKKKREIGQAARLDPGDVAQNRGGSRPFTEFQQYLEHTYGPEKASDLKTYQVMKTGLKNIDLSPGTSGPITSKKVQKRIDDYSTAASVEHPDDWEQRPFDPAILYQINGGLPHGRLPMGNGIVSKSVVQAAAKSKSIRPSNSSSYRAICHENQELRLSQKTILSENQELRQNQELHRQVIVTLLEKSNLPTPPELLQVRAHAQEQAMEDGTDFSHVSPVSKNNAVGDPDSADGGANNVHDGRQNGDGQNQGFADAGSNNEHNGDLDQDPAEDEIVPVILGPSTEL